MKKLIVITIVLLAVTFQLHAQNIIVKGGLNIATMLEQSDDYNWSEDLEYGYSIGYNAGVFAEFSVSEELSWEVGLALNTKGFKIDSEGDGGSLLLNYNLLFVDLPIKLKALYPISTNLKAYVAGGVSAGYAIGGTIDMEMTLLGETMTEKEDIKFGDDPEEDDSKRLDYGVIGGAGIMYKAVFIELNYYHGLANLSLETEDGYIQSTRLIGITLGYKFGF